VICNKELKAGSYGQRYHFGQALFWSAYYWKRKANFFDVKKIPFELMEEDRTMLYYGMKKRTFDTMFGISEGQLISDTSWTDSMFRFRNYFDYNKTEQNDYLFDGIIAGTVRVQEKEDHLEKYQVT